MATNSEITRQFKEKLVSFLFQRGISSFSEEFKNNNRIIRIVYYGEDDPRISLTISEDKEKTNYRIIKTDQDIHVLKTAKNEILQFVNNVR